MIKSILAASFFLLFYIDVMSQATATESMVKVSGDVRRPLQLRVRDLATMKRDTVQLVGKDGKTQTMTGVSVAEILKAAGVTTGTELKGKNLAKYLLVKCADGYQVVFSLAELDAAFTDRRVILADHADGKPLSAERGPFRLAVPGEKKPARSCYQVTDFVIRVAR